MEYNKYNNLVPLASFQEQAECAEFIGVDDFIELLSSLNPKTLNMQRILLVNIPSLQISPFLNDSH